MNVIYTDCIDKTALGIRFFQFSAIHWRHLLAGYSNRQPLGLHLINFCYGKSILLLLETCFSGILSLYM